MGSSGFDNSFGYGRLNAFRAIQEILPSIIGSNLVCSSGSTFSLDYLQPNTTISWSSSSNISFPSGNTGSSVSAQASSSTASGNGWLEATLTTSNGSFSLPRKDVWVGVPNNLWGEIGEQEDNEDQFFCKSYHYSTENSIKIRCNGADFDHSYQWDILSNNFAYNIWNNRIDIQPHTEGFIVFIVKVENGCGWSDWGEFIYPVMDCDGSGGELFMMYSPNPANQYTELNFYTTDEISQYQKSFPTMKSIPLSEQTQELGEYEIQIWHERKGLVKKIKSKDKKLQIRTNSLDEGLYFLHVIIDGKVYKQKLKIER
jgi:hypothetical protein